MRKMSSDHWRFDMCHVDPAVFLAFGSMLLVLTLTCHAQDKSPEIKSTPSTLPSGERSTRLRIPDATSLKDATRLVEDLYKADIAKAKRPGEISATVKKLLDAANGETVTARRFALLASARDLSIRDSDLETSVSVIDIIDREFEVDGWALKSQAATAVSKSLHTVEEQRVFVEAATGLVNRMVASERYDLAEQVCSLTVKVARDSDPMLGRIQAVRLQRVKEAQRIYADANKSMAVLAQKPNDPDANLVAGKYRCYLRNDWPAGLAMLSRGSDATLKAMAAKELSSAGGAKESKALGDNWWALGDKQTGIAALRIHDHASSLYKMALPELNGLEGLLLQKRIAQAAEADSDTEASRLVGKAVWISESATYTVSSLAGGFNPPLPNLLNGKGGGYQYNQFAFHTGEGDPAPYIIIDLGAPAQITRLEIVNRRDVEQTRAKTLAAWSSDSNKGPWRAIWEAKGAEDKWDIDLQTPVTSRFVKIGLREPVRLHLFSVKIFGYRVASSPKR